MNSFYNKMQLIALSFFLAQHLTKKAIHLRKLYDVPTKDVRNIAIWQLKRYASLFSRYCFELFLELNQNLLNGCYFYL